MTHPDFTIEELLAFARSKPADERYCYIDTGNCAVAQFGRATGREFLVDVDNLERFGSWLVDAANPYGVSPELDGSTFGALAKRLEALLPAKPVSDTWIKVSAYLNDIESVEG